MKNKYPYFLLFLGTMFLLLGIFTPINPKEEEVLQKESHYTVNLTPNPFYETTMLSEYAMFPSKGISSYSLDIAYNLSNPQNNMVTYEYEIFYEILGTVSQDSGLEQTIWKKRIPIKQKEKHQTTQDFSIEENIFIDYPMYNGLARSYEEAYGFPIHSILKVKIPLTYTIEKNKKTIQKENLIEYTITLDDVVSSIQENQKIKNDEKKEKSNIFPYLGFLFLLLGLGLILENHWKRNQNLKTKENKLLKEYKNQIISVDKIPSINNITIFELSNKEDLIRLATQYEVHIIYYQKEKCFYLFLENCIYLLKDSK